MWLMFEDVFHDFEAYRRCPLERIFLHRLEENETDTVGNSENKWSYDIVFEAFSGVR